MRALENITIYMIKIGCISCFFQVNTTHSSDGSAVHLIFLNPNHHQRTEPYCFFFTCQCLNKRVGVFVTLRSLCILFYCMPDPGASPGLA